MISPVSSLLLASCLLIAVMASNEVADVSRVDVHKFNLEPYAQDRVCSLCEFYIETNSEPDRIPRDVTEIICRIGTRNCAQNSNYYCRQFRTTMSVIKGGQLRNQTFFSGCFCARGTTGAVSWYLPPPEKRSNLLEQD